MTQWYVKDLSKLTQVSVQTLHHYDRIDLLKPSVRLDNNYRLYSEKDLLKLQQIIALKFFGFELAQIKTLLAEEVDVLEHFSLQSKYLEEKAKTLATASDTLKNIISECQHNKSIPWETIIKVIEVYNMTQELEKKWGKALNSAELKELAKFEQEKKTKLSNAQKNAFEQEWQAIVEIVNNNLTKDPTSQFGIDIGKRVMLWVNNYYGQEHISLRNAIWEKGFKSGNADAEPNLSPEGVAWIDKSIDSYYRDRIGKIFSNIGVQSDAQVLKLWEALLDDMYGDDQLQRQGIVDAVMQDAQTKQVAKDWLKKNCF